MDEQGLADRRRLFGTNGIRGVVGNEMTAQFALEMGLAIGTYFGGRIAIGTDTRTSREMLKNAVISGLLASGSHAVDLGIAPTPAVQYFVSRTEADAGIVVTASHNPPEFNGIKVIDGDGTELHFSKELEIEEIYFSRSFSLPGWRSVGQVTTELGANDRYIEGIAGLVDRRAIEGARLRVVVDSANGVGALVTPKLLRRLGVEVLELNSELDGGFPGHPSEPTPEHLESLIERVASEGVSFGLAHDGDADRTIFVDDTGSYVMGDRSFALLAGYVASKNPGAVVVSTIATSDCVTDVVAGHGGKVVQTRVGSPVVARKMMELNAIFGGEENGGLIYAPHQYCRDGAMTAALMAQLVAEQGPLSEQLKRLPVYHHEKLKIGCPDDRKKEVLSRLAERVGDKRVDLMDGVKIFESEREWVLVRPSGTEPIFRVFSQTREAESARELARRYLRELEEIIG